VAGGVGIDPEGGSLAGQAGRAEGEHLRLGLSTDLGMVAQRCDGPAGSGAVSDARAGQEERR
jgi:hypothetical protein